MTSSSITSWQIEVGKVGAVTAFLFSGSKITADGDCSHEIKRRLLLGRKAMTKRILKSRNITWPTKVWIDRAMVFPVGMYKYKSWTIQKAWPKEFLLLNCGVGEDS